MEEIEELEAVDLITRFLFFLIRTKYRKQGKDKKRRQKGDKRLSCFNDVCSFFADTITAISCENGEGNVGCPNLCCILLQKDQDYDIPRMRKKARTDIWLVRANLGIQMGIIELVIECIIDGNDVLSTGNAWVMIFCTVIPALLLMVYYWLTKFRIKKIYQSSNVWATFVLLTKISNVVYDLSAGSLLLTITRGVNDQNDHLVVLTTYSIYDFLLELYEIIALYRLICFRFKNSKYKLNINPIFNAAENRLQDRDTDREPPMNEGIDPTSNSDRQQPGPPTPLPPLANVALVQSDTQNETIEAYQPLQTSAGQVYPPPQPTEVYQPLAPPTYYLPPPPPPPPAQYVTPYPVLSQSQYTMQPFVPPQPFAFQSLFGTALDPSLPRQTAPIQTTLTGIGSHYASGNNFQMQSTTTVVHL